MLEAPAQAPDTARAAAQDLGRLDSRQLAAQGPQDHFVDSHGSFPRLARKGHRHLLVPISHRVEAVERSCHVLFRSGQMMCSQH
jgi:hypothetical protein